MSNKRVGKHTNKREAVKNNRRGSPLAQVVPYDVPSTEEALPTPLRVHVVKPGISIEQIMENIKGINEGDSIFGKETITEDKELSNGESEVVYVQEVHAGRVNEGDNGSGAKPIRKSKSPRGRKQKAKGEKE